jgi:hypothetical protein
VRGVHGVHGGEFVQVGQVDRRPHDVGEACAGTFEQRTKVPHHLLGLRRDVPLDEGVRLRIETDLSREEQQTSGTDAR